MLSTTKHQCPSLIGNHLLLQVFDKDIYVSEKHSSLLPKAEKYTRKNLQKPWPLSQNFLQS
jgi:hypothetical protein